MRLILFGLALLAGDVISQEFETFFNELPFGARLPGYERPIAAYSYTIKEQLPHHQVQNSEEIVQVEDKRKHFRNQERLHVGNNFKDDSSNEDNELLNLKHEYIDSLTQNFIPADVGDNNQVLNIDDSNYQKSEIVFSSDQALRNDDSSESILGQPNRINSYLPPIEEKTEPLDLSYLPPIPTTELKGDLYFKPHLPNDILPDISYLPPEQSHSSNFKQDLSYIPPTESKNSIEHVLDTLTLPSVEVQSQLNLDLALQESKVSNIDDSYLPPTEISKPDGSYLPPLETKIPLLDNSYLPPPETDILIPDISYLPPKKTEVSQNLNNYLPPGELKIIQDNSYLLPQKHSKSKDLDTSYVPPNNNIEEDFPNNLLPKATNKQNVKLPIEQYLPPEGKIDLKTELGSYLPPEKSLPVKVPKSSILPPIFSYRKRPIIQDVYNNPVLILRKPNVPAISAKSSRIINRYKPKKSKERTAPYGLAARIVNQPITPIRVKSSQHSFQKYKIPLVSGINGHRVCTYDSDCRSHEICQNDCCTDGCEAIRGTCIGNARCQTRRNTPSCFCPPSFVAQTVRGYNSVQYDCMAMSMNIASIRKHAERDVYRRTPQVRPVQSPIRANRPISRPVSRPVSRPDPFYTRTSGNPCSPSPCGDNTRCDVNPRSGIAQCRCVDGFIPDDHTIEGCKPQCVRDDDCPDDYRCNNLNRCERVCQRGSCGLHANCEARNHRAQCRCPPGYVGNPDVSCRIDVPEIRNPPQYEIDPCDPNPCGFQADCRVRGDRPVCSCPVGSEGDPLINCRKGECINHEDCPRNQACKGLRCINPCELNICGSGANCETRNHQPVCSCPRGHIGDPFTSCRRVTEYDLCNPTPCGPNTNCKARSDRNSGDLRAVCSCVDPYIGDPLTGCRPECERDTDCSSNQGCINNRCRNPCVDACGTDAYCDVINHRAVCRCHEFAIGNPNTRCYFECTEHSDCNSNQACSQQYRCIDPCDGACGTDANCEVSNHTPICSCPKDRTGDPFKSCRLFTLADLCADNPCGTNADCNPGKDRSGNDRPVCTCLPGYIGNPLISCQRGECQDHNSCPNDKACYQHTCQSPCFYLDSNSEAKSVCGENAECTVDNHVPVCRCAQGWSGNPLERCVIAANARVAGSSARRVSGASRFVDDSRYFKK